MEPGFRIASSNQELQDFMDIKIPAMVLISSNSLDERFHQAIAIVKNHENAAPIIVFSKGKDTDFIVQTIKLGVHHYYECPDTLDEFVVLLEELKQELFSLASENTQKTPANKKLPGVIGESEFGKSIAERVFKIAPLDINVMIWGETGTGKEVIARALHKCSERSAKPFIPVDCVSLPPNLIESELFGHEQGAFTGAGKAKKGLLELADGGTLFLDEITELDVYLQGKLLRVLQEQQFRRVGGQKMINVSIRVLSATNRNPEEAIMQNKLRKDLYYRLNAAPLHLLPLRQRKQDIPFLSKHFIEEINKSNKVEIKGITQKALNVLANYDWPGNIRELQNVILQTVAFLEGNIIDEPDLPVNIRPLKFRAKKGEGDADALTFKQAKDKYLREFCQAYFDDILKKYHGNISKVALEAELSRGTIYKIFKDFDIQNPYTSP